jgi:3-phenylpropionate/trans-cinnamate dioxygenase ferredoxin reductase subunit
MTSTRAGLLVVGAGQAAVELVSNLLAGGWSSPITVVGDETVPPYQRPPLSKGIISGATDEALLPLRSPQYFVEHGVSLVLGEHVEDLRTADDGSGWATCRSGRRLPYDRVVLALGSSPRDLPGCDGLAGVFRLHTVDDARALRPHLSTGRRVVVLGAGFVGLEVAATARKLGCRVTVVEMGPRVLGRVAGEATAAHVATFHQRRGIDIRLGTVAQSLREVDGQVRAVELSDGTECPADVVLVAVGAVPNTELAERAGLMCRGGIVVDESCRTSDVVTLAIGDCAIAPEPNAGAHRGALVRLESVDNAVRHGQVAARTLFGEAPGPGVPPWFWSDQGDLKLQIAGLVRPEDVCVVRRDPDGERLLCVYYRDGVMVGVEAVGSPADFMALRKALGAGVSPDPEAIRDHAVNLRSLLRAGAAVS